MGSTFGEFCENTSAHGFIDFWNAKNPILKTFWVIIIFLSSLIIGYFVYQVILDYQSAPFATNIIQNYSKTMIIPFAAVCNPALLNTTKLEEDGFATEIIYCILSNNSPSVT